MNLAFCVEYKGQLYRLAQLTESKAGLYLVWMGAEKDNHHSYHVDGTRHDKVGTKYHNRFASVPLQDFESFTQLLNASIPLTPEWLKPRTVYTGERTSDRLWSTDGNAIFGERVSLDVFLTDQAHEAELMKTVHRHFPDRPAHIMAEVSEPLTHFPNLKVVSIVSRRTAQRSAGDEKETS
jgi:hypothetical protein